MVEIEVKASHPFLLEALDEWLQLELLSEYDVRQLCEQNLFSVLPVIKSASKQPQLAVKKVVPKRPKATKKPSKLKQMLQSLMAELSVLWLLLLGVFMIVISSGVIAAKLWDKFPASGQYGVLLIYTLLLWGATFWSNNKPNLRLTSMALRLVTLLLVPMNFFAMDSLGLWQNPLDLVIVVIAAFSLSLVTVDLFKEKYQTKIDDRFSRSLSIHLGLSYLHWGWGFTGFALWATYLGVVGTAVVMLYSPSKTKAVAETKKPKAESLVPFSLNGAIATYALVILIIRAIFIANVDITQLGLAVGISGWLIIGQKKSSLALCRAFS